MNGDGIDDMGIIGGNSKKAYVLYGRTNFTAQVHANTIADTRGFTVDLPNRRANISKAGDLNDDGINDIILDSRWLLFGRTANYTASLDPTTLDGITGFDMGDGFRLGSHAGDFNKDGIDDIAINKNSDTYILFGKNTAWNPTLDITTLGAIQMARIRSNRANTLSFAGDVNDDGFDDIILGWKGFYGSHLNGFSGEAYLVHGYAISDTEVPDVTCPSDQTLAVGSTLPDYTGMVTVNDNCDPDPTLVQSPAAGSAYTSGMRITMTATDASGNSENCSFLVNDDTDTTPPTITCPERSTGDMLQHPATGLHRFGWNHG